MTAGQTVRCRAVLCCSEQALGEVTDAVTQNRRINGYDLGVNDNTQQL